MKKKYAALALTAVLAVSAAVPAAAAQNTAENVTASSAEDLLLSMETSIPPSMKAHGSTQASVSICTFRLTGA